MFAFFTDTSLAEAGLVSVVAPAVRKIPSADRHRVMHIEYADGRGVLRQVLGIATSMGFGSSILRTRRTGDEQKPMVSMEARFGRHPLRNLVLPLMDLPGAASVTVRGTDSSEDDEDDDDDDDEA